MKLKEFKSEIKAFAAFIKESNVFYKECQRGNKDWSDYHRFHKEHFKWNADFRHLHITYCLLRGTKYEQIEVKVKEGNEPNWTIIEKLMDQYREPEEVTGEAV